MTMQRSTSLQTHFKRQAVRWSLMGFAVTALLAVPCLIYSEKVASERQLLTVARAGATAYRPMILEGNTRDAEIQIRSALELKDGESAVVRDAKLAPIYALDPTTPEQPRCSVPGHICWSSQFRTVSLLYPLYFDEPEHKSLFGYLEVTLKPALDYSILYCLLLLLLGAFIGQAFGLSNGLAGTAKTLSSVFSEWADHLKSSPNQSIIFKSDTPFIELKAMKEAVNGLHVEIRRLQDEAANDARVAAHLSLLRSVGHDLRTPHAQLAKQVALLVGTVEETGKLDTAEVSKVNRTMRRMGELIRQVRALSIARKPSDEPNLSSVSLGTEIKTYLDDLRDDPEVIEGGAKIEFSSVGAVPNARVSKLEFYRVLENLVRNAISAVNDCGGGQVNISLLSVDGWPTIRIRDNGAGIADNIKDRIFDFNFTTKPARGTGLGLGIVKHICGQSGATLTFTSEINQGTEFQVSFLPAQKQVFTELDVSQGVVYGEAQSSSRR